MANENKNNEKALTKYELKQEKRRAEAAEEKKSWKKFQVGFGIVAAALVAAILISVGMNAYDKYAAVNKPYITVGEHEITEVEFDYYYSNAVNSYLNAYGSMAPLFGFDTSKPLDQQPHSEGMTWKDIFDREAATEIARVKALADDARNNGFVYDDAEDIAAIEGDLASQAEKEGVTIENYYSRYYGKNATVERIKPFMKENALATAYEAHLIQLNQPTEEEIEKGYADNKMGFDLIDCRKYFVKAEVAEGASEEEVAEAMKAAKEAADEFAARREKGESFVDLCVEYAPEKDKAYFGEGIDGSLLEDGAFYDVPSVAVNWLYDESRTAGDVTVLEDAEKNQYCVVEYLDRSNDWTVTQLSIASSLAKQKVSEHLNELLAEYEVKEARGTLQYLHLEAAE